MRLLVDYKTSNVNVALGLLAAFSLLAQTGLAGDYPGKVVGVLDGDTLEFLNGHNTERIRLSGIDCPEKGQAFGTRAKQGAPTLAFGKEVTVQTYGHDKYKRTIGNVLLPDGMNLDQELVKQVVGIGDMRLAPRSWES
jgi:endonuclease YncB( thermonuclease family)